MSSRHTAAPDVSFGAWIQTRRKALDLTQDELAQRVGCSLSAIRKIESDERRPSRQVAELLAEHLRLPPEQRELFARVARAELRVDRLPPATPDAQPARASLPCAPTPLVGREPELATLARLLHDPQCRLLTLIGPGGMGKTRLALEAAARGQAAFGDGAAFVSLAPLSSAEFIAPAIADALGLSFQGQAEPRAQLIRQLSTRRLLLVLDNMEHLLGGADLVTAILERAPGMKLLATSRERLNVQGEWVFEIQGLPVPPAGQSEHLDDYSAVALFVQCARRAQAGFELRAEERPAVANICRLVAGMPLGIELAAAWVAVLSCREIAREIERNLDFLATTLRDAPARHRSLRAAFDHSWKLLAAEERAVLSRLATFQGGFTREAAEQVAEATLPGLAALTAKSLVRRAESGRYDLHEVIRQYASAHLARDNSQCRDTRDRHSDFYLRLASASERRLKSAAQPVAMREMTLELDNLRAAWDWGIRCSRFESLGPAVRAYGWYFEVAGLIQDGIDQFELLVHALRGAERDSGMNCVLGSSLVQQGLLCFRSGQFARAQALYDEAIATLRLVNAPALLADALIFSGTIMYLSGAYGESRELIREGLAHARATNEPWFAAFGVYNLGHIDSLTGNYQQGYEQMQEGLRLWRMLGDPHSISLGLNFLVETQLALGRQAEALASMQESLALSERTQNRWGMGTAYRYLGLARLAAGQYAEAQRHLQQSLETFGDDFKGWDIARTLIYLGEARRLAGEHVAARATLVDALRLAHSIDSSPLTLDALLGLASLDAQAGDAERAWQLTDCVGRHAASTAEARARAAQLCAEVEARLTTEDLEALQARAPAMSLQSAVHTILGGA